MKKLSKTIWTIVMAIGLLALFSTCSGTLGGDSGIVRIAIPGVGNASSGRFVDATTMTKGYVILGQGDQVYSVDDYPKTQITGGEVILSNIAEGTYILGVILQNDKDNVTGLALKEITVKPGYNDVEVTVGPGIRKLEILGANGENVIANGPLDFSNSAYSLSFAKDTMIFNYGRTDDQSYTVNYYPTFGEGSKRSITEITASLIDADGGLTADQNSPFTAGVQQTTNASATVTVSAQHTGVQFAITDSEKVTYTYKLILE